ncbi:AMP-dependent synthetase/ligase [Longispora albida]|uniref:AMP-dependent synthetase/ligase n=1 Tax=Longispora albida TaxID=203523 RepID=UPI0003614F71|nr:AMP-dependent synthetase/ligase [Longispora albida]
MDQEQAYRAALAAPTLNAALRITAGARRDEIAVRTADGAVAYTYGELLARAERVAAGLAGLGVSAGDTVAVMLVNRPEFHVVDIAAMLLGAVPFSVYNSSSAEQVAQLFADAGNRIVVTEPQFLEKVKSAETIVLVDELPEADGFAEADVQPDDLLTLIYTSGTTGQPKGVEISHRTILAQIRGAEAALGLTPGGRTISYLPMAHLADRWISHYTAICVNGGTVTCCPAVDQLVGIVPEVRPTVLFTVPRLWQKLKATLDGMGVTPELGPVVRERLGLDECRWLILGSAPTPREVLEFFAGLGIEILEGWGMTETSGGACVNRPGAVRIGTVGVPYDGVEVRLAEDGELLCRGEICVSGYRGGGGGLYTDDGWLRTGDLAAIDADGYVTITGRKKDLIISSAGKNMSPALIEGQLRAASPLIGHAVCVGDGRPYNVALIVLDPDLAEAAGDVEAAVAEAVGLANERLSKPEQIRRWTILPGTWEPSSAELTPTLKLRRAAILGRYRKEIEGLYV